MRRNDKRTWRRAPAVTAVCMSTVVLSGCGVGLESLPLSVPNGSADTYSVTAVFANALNLPARAKVKLNGADIGEVESIRARDFTAHVAMNIRDDVRLASGATAELRSATPLGDLFVAVTPDPNAPPDESSLHNGDMIPLQQTATGASVEQVLSSAALLVNGGVIRNLTSLLNGAGEAVGGNGTNIATLLQESNTLISRLNSRSAQIQEALQNTSDLAATLAAHQRTINDTITAAAPATAVLAENTTQIADLTTTVARITTQLSRFPSLRGTDSRSMIADINRLSATFNEISVDPNLSLTALNRLIPIVMKSTSSAAVNSTGVITQLALGSLPDMNYPGDPAFHGPDGTNWHDMIGSLRYQWNLLLSRIYGPNR